MGVLVAMGVFVGSHILLARSGLKAWAVARLGEPGYLIAYSGLSIALLAWVIVSLLTAERVMVWPAPSWAYGFALVVSAVGFVLIGVGAFAANPLSVAFRKRGFDPHRPGLIGWVRHPLIWGLTLWGLAHLPANGDWPSLALFGGSAAFGGLGVVALERRLRRRLGEHKWQRLSAGSGHIDKAACAGAALGLALWAAFLALHPVLFGVDPLGLVPAEAR
ncbi:MAG: NnrU family protein [Pseudomonadota bacterium]